VSEKDSDHYQNQALTRLSPYESYVFDWLILEGAENDCTRWDDDSITQLALEGLDIFLGCATTDDPNHVAEVAVLTECGAHWNAKGVWNRLSDSLSVKPDGVWFDVTTSDRAHAWIVWSITGEELCGKDFDYTMKRFLEFVRGVVELLNTTNWSD
jgi:hypothetical protein